MFSIDFKDLENELYINNIIKAFECGKEISCDKNGLYFYQSIYDSIYDKEMLFYCIRRFLLLI